jgi:hypothetical protein
MVVCDAGYRQRLAELEIWDKSFLEQLQFVRGRVKPSACAISGEMKVAAYNASALKS